MQNLSAATCLVVGFVVLLCLYFLTCFLLGWLVTLVAGGFGYELPLWPTVGAVFLVQVVLGAVGGAISRK